MNYRPTILNISTTLFLCGILIYTILNYETLSKDEGWGIIAMLALTGIALIAGLIDLILQKFIKNRSNLNIIGLFIAIGLSIVILSGL